MGTNENQAKSEEKRVELCLKWVATTLYKAIVRNMKYEIRMYNEKDRGFHSDIYI